MKAGYQNIKSQVKLPVIYKHRVGNVFLNKHRSSLGNLAPFIYYFNPSSSSSSWLHWYRNAHSFELLTYISMKGRPNSVYYF